MSNPPNSYHGNHQAPSSSSAGQANGNPSHTATGPASYFSYEIPANAQIDQQRALELWIQQQQQHAQLQQQQLHQQAQQQQQTQHQQAQQHQQHQQQQYVQLHQHQMRQIQAQVQQHQQAQSAHQTQQQQQIFLGTPQQLVTMIEQQQIPNSVHSIQQHQQQMRLLPVNAASTAAPPKPNPKPRGRVTSYAFFVQTCHQDHQKRNPSESINFKDFSRHCSEKWKGMTEAEKQPYVEMAENDKKRYNDEMKTYVPDPALGKKRKSKGPKDPNAPKKAISAFFHFCADERGAIKEANPSYSVGEVAKELGRMWATLDPDVKDKYKKVAEDDKIRYDKECAEYKEGKKICLSSAAAASGADEFLDSPVSEEDNANGYN